MSRLSRMKQVMPVRISIDSAQTRGAETQDVRMLTLGMVERLSDGFILTYQESDTHEFFGTYETPTRLVCQNGRVTIDRGQPEFVSQVFDTNGQYTCCLREPFMWDGYFLSANAVDYRLGETDGHIRLEFSLMDTDTSGAYSIQLRFDALKQPVRRRSAAARKMPEELPEDPPAESQPEIAAALRKAETIAAAV